MLIWLLVVEAEDGHAGAEGVGEFDEMSEGLLHLTHVVGDVGGHAGDFFDGVDDELGALGLAVGGGTYALDEVRHLFCDYADGFEGDAGLGDQLGLHDDLGDVLFDALGDGGGFLLDSADAGGDFTGGFGAMDGQGADLLGDGGEALAALTSSHRFNGSVERQQVHAGGEVGNGKYGVVDLLAAFAKALHDAGRLQS